MKRRKTFITAKVGYIIISSVICVLEVILILFPTVSSRNICRIIGATLAVYGVIKIIGLFSKDIYALAFQYDLAFGVLMCSLGVIMLTVIMQWQRLYITTFSSVVGGSMTTVAGFIALCFMTFTLGRDLGIVMAKGVVLGVLGCVTVLPSLILVCDKLLNKTMHKALIPKASRLSDFITKRFPAMLLVFIIVSVPAYIGYRKTNKEMYYDLGATMPGDMPYVIANDKLSETFGISATHMVLVSTDTPEKDVRAMISEMEIVAIVERSITLPIILVSVIQLAIFINRSLLHYFGQQLILR